MPSTSGASSQLAERASLAREPRPGRRFPTAGITLVELLVSLSIIGLLLAIAYPNVTSGLDGIRVRTLRDNVAGLIQEARLRADRLNRPVQIWLSPKDHLVRARAIESKWERELELPESITIVRPASGGGFLLMPGAPPPAFRLLLETASGDQAGFELNPFLGVAKDWVPEDDE